MVEIYILRKWFQNNFLKIEASVGHPQRRGVPRKDQSAERGVCRKLCRNRREILLVLEKRRSHGCCHISFPKSWYDGKHAKVRGVSRWVEVKR